jgi:hypothetical protein
MQVIDVGDRFEEVAEVVFFGEAGELLAVVEADVDQGAHACLAHAGEEDLGALLGKADGEKLDGVHRMSEAFWIGSLT